MCTCWIYYHDSGQNNSQVRWLGKPTLKIGKKKIVIIYSIIKWITFDLGKKNMWRFIRRTHFGCNNIFYFITKMLLKYIKQNKRSVGDQHFLIYWTGKLDFIAWYSKKVSFLEYTYNIYAKSIFKPKYNLQKGNKYRSNTT